MNPEINPMYGATIMNPKKAVLMDFTNITPYKRPLVIYHANCADGFAAAWCFHHSQEEAQISYDFHPGVYGEELPDVEDRIVYMVDFSYKADKVAKILELCNGLYFIDHHKTAIEDLEQFFDHPKFCAYVDLERSGAMLAWDFLYNTEWNQPEGPVEHGWKKLFREYKSGDPEGYKEPPMLLAHVQDRDLWKFKLEGTRPIHLGMASWEQTFELYDTMMLGGVVEKMALWEQGAAIERKYFKDIDSIIESTLRFVTLDQMEIPMVNAPGMFASDIGSILAKRYRGVAASYYDTATQRVFSLRSIGDIDVSAIAVLYDGGGHKNAAGFKVSREHILART